jgi:hypothetical protein
MKNTKKSHIKNNKTRKSGGDKKVNDCMNSKCKLWLEEAKVNIEKFKKNITKNCKKTFAKEKKLCNNKNKSKKTKEECENIQTTIKIQKKMLENLEKNKEKYKKLELDVCKKFYCNEGCKDTILEDGDPNILPKLITKKFKKNTELIKLFEKERKELFGEKKTVLKNGFYEKIKPSQIEKIKKEGAISGCVTNL